MQKDVGQLTQNSLRRTIARTYLIALSVIAFVLTSFFIYIQISSAQTEVMPKVINMAGKQRMLSQRMAYLQTLITSTPNNYNARELQQKLSRTTDEFARQHEILTGNAPIGTHILTLTPEQKKLYFDGLYSLDKETRRFIEKSRVIADMPISQLSSAAVPSFTYADSLLERLDHAVRLYEKRLKSDMLEKRWTSAIVYLLLLCVLLSVIFILFRPLEKLVVGQFQQAHEARLDAQLQRADAERVNQVKANFLSRMSHEFRTPISSIIGALELIPNMRSRQEDLLLKAEQSCYKLLNLTNNLLDIISINADPGPSDDGTFDLIRLLDENIAPMSFSCRERNLDFSMHCTQLPQYVYGAPVEIGKALTNVLDNALKYTQKGFIRVDVDVKVHDKKYVLHIKVIDTGIGIEESVQEKIFERFYQADNAINRQASGAGIGLTVARRHLRNIGGDISVVSQQHVGSEFTLVIPLQPAQHQPAPAEASVSGKFAVVDDLAISRLYLTNVIQAQGYEAESFSSGSGLLALHDNVLEYNGLIIDYMMPGINGLELASTLHAMHGDKTPPIIMMSATPDIANLVANSVLSPWQVFLKPIDKNRFTDSLHQLARPQKQINPVTQGASVLIVEDEPINAEIISHMLENLGYRVTHADNGETALALCKDKLFDLVLMDINLPDISGIETTRILKERGYNAPVIAVTANAFESDKTESAAVGIRYHLVKPVSYQELKNTLKLALLKARADA